jgi:hypothetical protein
MSGHVNGEALQERENQSVGNVVEGVLGGNVGCMVEIIILGRFG